MHRRRLDPRLGRPALAADILTRRVPRVGPAQPADRVGRRQARSCTKAWGCDPYLPRGEGLLSWAEARQSHAIPVAPRGCPWLGAERFRNRPSTARGSAQPEGGAGIVPDAAHSGGTVPVLHRTSPLASGIGMTRASLTHSFATRASPPTSNVCSEGTLGAKRFPTAHLCSAVGTPSAPRRQPRGAPPIDSDAARTPV